MRLEHELIITRQGLDELEIALAVPAAVRQRILERLHQHGVDPDVTDLVEPFALA